MDKESSERPMTDVARLLAHYEKSEANYTALRTNQVEASMTSWRWVEKGLWRGDLTLLSRIAELEPSEAVGNGVDRLIMRGFVVRKRDASVRPTIKGRIALLIRRS